MQVHLVNENIRAKVTSQSLVRLDRGGLPSETLTGTCPVPPKRDRRVKGHNMDANTLPGNPAPSAGGFKSESLERGESVGGAEGAVLRVCAPWLIAQMYRFKFSPERPPRSWG